MLQVSDALGVHELAERFGRRGADVIAQGAPGLLQDRVGLSGRLLAADDLAAGLREGAGLLDCVGKLFGHVYAVLELRNASRWTGADDPVFATPSTGQPMARTDLMERYRDALAAAGLPVAFRFHDLRHTFASTLAQAGVPERQIMEWCGHASASMTRKYMHFALASAADVAAVDAAFGGRSSRRSNLSPASMPEGTSAQTSTP